MRCEKCGEEWIDNEKLLSLLDRRLALLERFVFKEITKEEYEIKLAAMILNVKKEEYIRKMKEKNGIPMKIFPSGNIGIDWT